MIQPQPNHRQRKRLFRVELLEQRIALSGVGVTAKIHGGPAIPSMSGHPHEEIREPAQQNQTSSGQHTGTSNRPTAHHPDNHPPRRYTQTPPQSTHAPRLTHDPYTHTQSHISAFEGSGRIHEPIIGLPEPSSAFNGLTLTVLTTAASPIHDPVLNDPAFTGASIPNTYGRSLNSSTDPTDPLGNSVIGVTAPNEPSSHANTNDNFTSNAPTAPNSRFANANPITRTTANTGFDPNSSVSSYPQDSTSTTDSLGDNTAMAEKRLAIKKYREHFNETSMDALFSSAGFQYGTQNQENPNSSGAQASSTDSIHQQLKDLDELLETLAVSRGTKYSINSTHGKVVNEGSEGHKNTQHDHDPTFTPYPMTLLTPANHSKPAFTGIGNTKTEQAQNSAQWGIPLGRHRTITSTILLEVNPRRIIWNGDPEESDSELHQSTDTKQQFMNFTPTAPRGFAMLCCMMVIPYVRRKYQQQRVVPTQCDGG